MTNWKDIHSDFTEELQKKWEQKGFDFSQVKDWIKAGLSPKDLDFANYLKSHDQTPAAGLSQENLAELRAKYRQWLTKAKNKNGELVPEKNADLNKKEQQLTQLTETLKSKLDKNSQDWLENLLEAQSEVVKTNSSFSLKQLTKAKKKLENKLSAEEIATLCQFQIELTHLQVQIESAVLPFRTLTNETVEKERLQSWLAASETNDTAAIKNIFQQQQGIINSYDQEGNTALHNAAYAGHLAAVTTLLELSDQIKVNIQNQDGFTPLHIAVSNCHWEIVNRLLEKKANPNAKSLSGNTPCHFAAGQNDLPLLQLLIKYGGDINAVNNYNWSILHSAASGIVKQKEDWAIMEWLLSREGIKIDIKTEDDFTVEDVFLQKDYSYAQHYNELVDKFCLEKANNQIQTSK